MSPPRLAEWLVRIVWPGEAGLDIAADLAEEFHLVASSHGRRRARRWYWSQAIRSALTRLVPPATEVRRGPFRSRPLAGALNDLKQAIRTTIRRPAHLTITAVALALGLCVLATTYAVVDAVLLQPLPYRDPHRLVTLRQTTPDAGGEPERVSPATFLEWRTASRAVDLTAAVRPWTFTWAADVSTRQVPGGLVTEGFFELLGATPAAGRLLNRDDYQPGAPRAVVIADSLWQALFGRDPGIIGRAMTWGSDRLTVVGVLPPTFWWIDRTQAIWGAYPLGARASQLRAQNYLTVVGRLSTQATTAGASAELEAIERPLSSVDPRVYRGLRLRVVEIHDDVTGSVRPALLLLLGAVAFVCLIAFLNFAGLLLARGVERRGEFEVRVALGAGPLRIGRQLVLENCVVVLVGLVLGLISAHWLLGVMVALSPADVPRLTQARIDVRTVLTATAVAAGLTIAVSLVPLLAVTRRTVLVGSGGLHRVSLRGSTLLRRWFVAAQVALTFVLLVSAGLLGRSFGRLTSSDPGFSPDHVALVELHVWGNHPQPAQQRDFFARALGEIRRLPGVVAAGAASAPPFLGGASMEMSAMLHSAGRSGAPLGTGWLTIVTPSYFEAMRIQVVAGRGFSDDDRAASPRVAIVSERLASRYLNGAAVGRRLLVEHERTPEVLEVVGVVADVRHLGLDQESREDIYVPLEQVPFGSMNLAVRTSTDPGEAIPAVLGVLRAIDPRQLVNGVRPLDELVARTLAPQRFLLALAGWLSATALVLAIVALHGLIRFVTLQQTREIGLRIALGAGQGRVLADVLRAALVPTSSGLLAGAVLAASLGGVLRGRLFGVEPTDPVTFAAVGAILFAIAALSAAAPAYRAMKINPVEALRHD